eukprot:GHVL01039891.1.p1 GENE.GHVL01039891.1~~GHVL01039891.1.p1  ORF type:complete len:265 (+),score=51.82 GHVL01039891.1:85-879(+)
MRIIIFLNFTGCLLKDTCDVKTNKELFDSSNEWKDDVIYPFLILDENRCDIDRISIENIQNSIEKPIIIKNINNNNFYELCKKSNLLYKYGDEIVTLSSANTFSHTKTYSTLAQHVEDHIDTHLTFEEFINLRANEIPYIFGSNWFEDLFKKYKKPPSLGGPEGSLSFGIGRSGSGVPFHIHGPVWAEVIHGRKRWFFSEKKPIFDPNETPFSMFYRDTKNGTDISNLKYMTCIVNPGEILWIPDMWWHGTLNIGQSVFMSTFV